MFSPALRSPPPATPTATSARLRPHSPRLSHTGGSSSSRGSTHSRAVTARASLYDLLGVTAAASTAEIRTAYRRLAARLHPDQNASLVAHEKFQALNLAAEVLTDEQLRRDYDRSGTSALPGSRYKFLLEFLKQARGQQGGVSVLGEPGSDLSTVLGLDFNEAVTGSAAAVTLDVLGPCGDCKGSGFEASTLTADCRVCRGSGEIMVRTWHPDGGSSSSADGGASMLMLPRGCPACRGSGKTDQQECKRCEGEGRVQLRRKVRFRVPGGVVDGQVLRVKGQGHSGKYGGAPGDLLVKLQVYDLADVTRHGYDLHSVLELPLYEALLGGSVPVRTVRGHRHILVPAGTQHGQLLCVKAAGVPRPGSHGGGVEYGHHYFEVAVRVPSAAAVGDSELHLLQQLGAAIQQQQGRIHHGRMQQQQQHGDASRIEQMRDHGQSGSGARHQQQNHHEPAAAGQARSTQAAAAGALGGSNHQHTSDPP